MLPTTAKRPVLTTAEVAVLGDTGAIAVGKLCNEFEYYLKAHPENRDQTNPPKRIAEIKEKFGNHIASALKASEIEGWLDEILEEQELANATINKMRGTFYMIFKHGKRKDLVNGNPAADVSLRDVVIGLWSVSSVPTRKNGYEEYYSRRLNPTIPSSSLSCVNKRFTDCWSSRCL